MATSAQLKALFRSFAEGDENRFYTYALQISAHEALLGHGKLAKELRDIIDAAKEKKSKITFSRETIPIAQPKGELASLISASFPDVRIVQMILDKPVLDRLNRIIKEQRQVEVLQSHGLNPRKKFLLVGPPGTGKTMTASALSGELRLPLLVIRLEGVITKFMGETSAKLRLIFDAIKQHRGVYLFDEFDSIGTTRTSGNDVGEIRRILNSFLQFIDQDESDSLLLAATNQPDILDYALFRRFDDVIEYRLPDKTCRLKLFKDRLSGFAEPDIDFKKLADESDGLSHAEISRACEDAIKEKIIDRRDKASREMIEQMIAERKKIHSMLNNHSQQHTGSD